MERIEAAPQPRPALEHTVVEADRTVDSPVVQAADQGAAAVNSKALFFSEGTYNGRHEQREESSPREKSEVSPGGKAREKQWNNK